MAADRIMTSVMELKLMISALIGEQREQMSSCTNASPRPRLIHNQILMAEEIQFAFLVFEDRRRVI